MSSTPQKPISFKRGNTFTVGLDIPDDYADGYFVQWEVISQVRQLANDTRSGLIANLATYWENAQTTRRLLVYSDQTSKWPLGLAETDILFKSPNNYIMRTKPSYIIIERGVSR